MIVDLHIRTFVDQDLDGIVQLSLLAWEPVFHSFRRVLGPNIYQGFLIKNRRTTA